MLIDGAVLTQQSTVPVLIESELGLLNLNRSSGRIDAAGALTLRGVDVLLDGPINSSFDNGAADLGTGNQEVRVIAQRDALLRGNLAAAKDILIKAGGTAEFYDNVLSASTLKIEAAAAFFGSPVSAASSSQKGSRIEVVDNLRLDVGTLGVHAGALLVSKGINSDITMNAANEIGRAHV